MPNPKAGENWTREELRAAVEAYLQMLKLQVRGEKFKKVSFKKAALAGPLSARSGPSYEFRMRNISSVMSSTGRPVLGGFVPAKNLGTRALREIEGLLNDLLPSYLDIVAQPTADPVELEKRLQSARKLMRTGEGRPSPPNGRQKPKRTRTAVDVFERDPLVKLWVLENSRGMCEGCGLAAPFTGMDSNPFLEVHHIRQLSHGGSDTITNAVALCPNCHRRCHYGVDREEYLTVIGSRVARLRPE